jgi:hypothetical protein
MIILNNAKDRYHQPWQWKPHKDYSPNGVIEYERGTLYGFMGRTSFDKSLVGKMFGEAVERDQTIYTIETVSQFPFKNDDIVIDDMGKEHLIKAVRFEDDKNQYRFLRSANVSRKYYLAVEGDE